MRLLVTGGRDYREDDLIYQALDKVHDETPVHLLIAGDARGADRIALRWATERGVQYHLFGADWRRYGNLAGPIRNTAMLTRGQPDLCVAFPGGKGTADMVRQCEKAGVPVRRCEP